MTIDSKTQTINCARCGQRHNIEIDFSKLSKGQLEGKETILYEYICPNIAQMYRVVTFCLDLRVNTLKNEFITIADKEKFTNQFKNEWGESDFQNKLFRYIDLDFYYIGITEEYYKLIWPVISSYCCGYYYPSMTSAGALGERILNRLILKTRDYFKSSPHYKKIYNKKSFDQWDKVIEILIDWEIINKSVGELFLELKKYRNDSIHYNENYNYQENAKQTIKTLIGIIDLQFSYLKRKDLFWLFDVPGEILLRSNMTDNPFVKEFVLPHCIAITPFCEPTSSPPYFAKESPLKPLTDLEFIEIRNNRKIK